MKNVSKNEEVINMDNKNITCDHKSLNDLKEKLKMESKVVKDGDEILLKVHLTDNFYAEVKDDSIFDEVEPLNVCLTYEDIAIYNVSTKTLDNCVSIIKDMQKVADGFALIGFDNKYDVEKLSNEVIRMLQRRIKIHNLLVDYNFKIDETKSKDELVSMGINPKDYIVKGKSFMNKSTKKFVTIY